MPIRKEARAVDLSFRPTRLRDDRFGLIALGLLALGFVAATLRIWITPTWYLDDYLACGLVDTEGLAGLVEYYWDWLGLYRLIWAPFYLLIGPLCDVPVLQKAVGLTLHLTAGVLLYKVLRIRLQWSRIAVIGACTVFMFSPLALEAVSWVAAIKHFPLALVFVLLAADRLLTDPPKVGAAVLFASLAVISGEQTILLILTLPFISIGGPWLERLKVAALVGGPSVIYLGIIKLTGGFGANPRLSGELAASPRYLIDNLPWARDYLTPFIPGGWRWNEFARGNWTGLAIGATVLVILAIVISARPKAAESRLAPPSSGLSGIAVGAALIVAAALPLLLAPDPWNSPRVWYLPHACLALGVGGLLHWLSQIGSKQTMRTVCALLVVGWALLVVDGVAREANAYVTNFAREKNLAETINAAMEPNDELILLNSPWSLLSLVEAPLIGDHIVQAFATNYGAVGALRVLTGANPLDVIIGYDADAVCVLDSGVVLVEGRSPRDNYLIFDVATMQPVAEGSESTALFECD